MLFLKGKTPPKFLQIRFNIIAEGFGEEEEGHRVGRNGIGNCFDEGGVGSLGKEFGLPTRNFAYDLLFQVSICFYGKRGEDQYVLHWRGFGEDLGWR